jgi:hypothetical protein
MALVALGLLVASAPACGKYGKPVRTSPAPPAGVSAQPNAAAPAGEACEEEVKDPETEDKEPGLVP